jgi:hypothetical protein
VSSQSIQYQPDDWVRAGYTAEDGEKEKVRGQDNGEKDLYPVVRDYIIPQAMVLDP